MKLCESVIDALRRLKPRGANRHMKIQFFLKGAHCSFQLIDIERILHSIAFENIGACKNSKSFLSWNRKKNSEHLDSFIIGSIYSSFICLGLAKLPNCWYMQYNCWLQEGQKKTLAITNTSRSLVTSVTGACVRSIIVNALLLLSTPVQTSDTLVNICQTIKKFSSWQPKALKNQLKSQNTYRCICLAASLLPAYTQLRFD